VRGAPAARKILLKDTFFRPQILRERGADEILFGASRQLMHEPDGQVADDLRNLLLLDGTVCDQVALDIQRARDHRLPSYNDMRAAFGLGTLTSFAQLSNDETTRARFAELYGGDISKADAWCAGICETHADGAQVGELFQAVIWDQFQRLRDGDRFWFELDPALNPQLVETIRATRLSHLLRRNCDFGKAHLCRNVFQYEH
jgi:hypothetical protein